LKAEDIDKGAILKALRRARRTDLKKLEKDLGNSRDETTTERLEFEIKVVEGCLGTLLHLARRVARESIRPGSLVVLQDREKRPTTILLLYEKVCLRSCSELPVVCAAADAPLPKLLLNRKKDESVFFNGHTYKSGKVQ
jgi:hypothetical protein